MLTIAVTGGVACGKSAFCRRFSEGAPPDRVASFSCDAAVREISAEPAVRDRLSALAREFGWQGGAGESPGKVAFRELLFENADFRGRVEAVLHPLVLRRAMADLAGLSERVRVYLVEVPLLYEVEFPLKRNLDWVVASSAATQWRRLTGDRGLEPDTARKILDSQLPIDKKIQRADLAVWNDGSLAALEAQADHLFSRFRSLLSQ